MTLASAHRPNRDALVALLSGVDADAWGSVTSSVYETARVAVLMPELPGQDRRIDYLLAQQNSDGSWCEGPARNRLIPTLSAVDAALGIADDYRLSSAVCHRLEEAVRRGLAALRSRSMLMASTVDTAAAELVVPELIDRINRRLVAHDEDAMHLLRVPPGYGEDRWRRLRRQIGSGGMVPTKLHHTFEAIAQCCPQSALPLPKGLLGSSPAATAAWLSRMCDSPCRRQSIDELTAVGRHYGWVFPEAAPFASVERLWVIAAALRVGVPESMVGIVRRWVAQIYDPGGVRGAPGLAPDADDTAMAVHISAGLGDMCDPAVLSQFETASHYACYRGEETGSVTANAHALQATVSYLRRYPGRAGEYGAVLGKVRRWLIDQQTADGYWIDKWHASPYYATAHCVAALAADGDISSDDAIDRAARWVEETQRSDGTWGWWVGTAEESAYAAQVLLRSHPESSFLERAPEIIEDVVAGGAIPSDPPMWQDKTTYTPLAIVKAELIVTAAALTDQLSNTPVARGS